MVCYECGMSLASSREISVKFGVPLCGNHLLIIEKNLKKHFYGLHVANLYYALKKQGLNPFIGWWNGKRFVPISLGRQRINIEILYGENQTHQEALIQKEHKTYDHNHHFIHLQIATSSIENHLSELAGLIYDLHESLKYY
jgi:hypothetical protein